MSSVSGPCCTNALSGYFCGKGREVTSQRINNDCFLMGEKRRGERGSSSLEQNSGCGPQISGKLAGKNVEVGGRGGRVAGHAHTQRRHDSACGGSHSCFGTRSRGMADHASALAFQWNKR